MSIYRFKDYFFPTGICECFTWISAACSCLELAHKKCRRQIEIFIPALQPVYSEMQGDAWGDLGIHHPELDHSSSGTLQRSHVWFLFACEGNVNSTHLGSECFAPLFPSAFTSLPALQGMHCQPITRSVLVQSFLYFFPLQMVFWILAYICLMESAHLVMAMDNIHISYLGIYIWILPGWRGMWLERWGQIT